MPVIECVPNISEGRRADVVNTIAQGLGTVPGMRVLDVQSDPAHNRSVLTLAGEPSSLRTAVLTLFEQAVSTIDLRQHQGEHPRLGAVDVVPFVPIEGVTMEECVSLAHEVGQEVAARFAVPVYLYEEAASTPARRNLEDIRRGEFEDLRSRTRPPGRRSSARACRSSPTTSTLPRIGWTSRRRSQRPFA
jgi:glutamate formiminotransferase